MESKCHWRQVYRLYEQSRILQCRHDLGASWLLQNDCHLVYWWWTIRITSLNALTHKPNVLYRVSQEECEILRESVPYVKLYRYNPKHLYQKLNGYGVNGHRKVWPSVVSTNCTPSVTQYSSTAPARQADFFMQWPWRKVFNTVALTSQDKKRSGGLRTVLRSLRRAKTWMREFL